jgi:hypothetical protein
MIACLVTLIVAGGDLIPTVAISRARRLLATWAQPLPLWLCTCLLYLEQRTCHFFGGRLWGLWITGFANYSPDLWGQLCRVSAPLCVTRREFSPPEGCMHRKCTRRQRRSWLVADQLLGNSVGAIESVVRVVLAFGYHKAATLERFGVFLLGTTRLLRGVASALRRLGLG